jgi:molybdopterin/thiamine biosynthesis adenylyltransferase
MLDGVEYHPLDVSLSIDSDVQHSAVLYRPADDGDCISLERLRAEEPGILVSDRILEQIAGLVQCRTPAVRLSPAHREEAVAAHLAGTPAAAYGVWAWYPWSRRLVHLLDRDEFIELRTDRNRNKITREEQTLLAGRRIGVVGLSAGHAIALGLAQERCCGELRLADADTLELSNLNRLRAGVHELGLPKAVVTGRAIAEIDPFLAVTAMTEGVRPATVDSFLLDGGRLDLLVEECDSLDVKLLLRERARELGIPVVMASSDRGLIDIERFDLEPDRPLLHGLAGGLDSRQLANLSVAEKVPVVIRVLGGREGLSRRMWDSLEQIGRTIEMWPQLASGVILNAATAVDVCRRILLGELRTSGRFTVDLDELIPA